jgi:hypothetical protein
VVVYNWLHARRKLLVILLATIFVFTSPLFLADCPNTAEAEFSISCVDCGDKLGIALKEEITVLATNEVHKACGESG